MGPVTAKPSSKAWHALFAKQQSKPGVTTTRMFGCDGLKVHGKVYVTFYKAAVESGRDLVIDLKQAYLLSLFRTSEKCKGDYPGPDDKHIKIYLPKKSWGLIDKDVGVWSQKQRDSDYKVWEREFLDYGNAVNCRDVSTNEKDLVFFCSPEDCQISDHRFGVGRWNTRGALRRRSGVRHCQVSGVLSHISSDDSRTFRI
jgi:hypothetical protein